MMSRFTHVWTATILLTLVVGCSDNAPGPDAAMDALTDTSRDAQLKDAPDTADGATDALDAQDDVPQYDGGVEPGPPLAGGVDAPVIPAAPDPRAHCNPSDWCWIHPSPFPQEVADLHSTEDGVYGVSYDYSLQGYRPLVWNRATMHLLPSPGGPLTDFQDMTTTDTGWLAIQRDGTVYDIGPDGIRRTVTLEGDEYESVSGISIDHFLATDERRTLVVRNGDSQTEHYELADSGMWPNGEIWTVTNRDTFEVRMNGEWTLFPGGGAGVQIYGEMGPPPASSCGGSELFARGKPAFLYRWKSDAQTWTPIDGPDARSYKLGCFPGGTILATDSEQGFWLRGPNGWSKRTVLERQIQDTVVHDDTLYVGGFHGNHALVTESETSTIGSGFWAPDISTPDRFKRAYRDLWVSDDGEQVVLSYEGKPYRSTGDGWSVMPGREDDRLLQPAINDVCGIDEPMFGLNDAGLFRWTGQEWVEENVNGDPRDRVQGSELACVDEDSIWMTAGSRVYHHDGNGWSQLGSEDSSVMSGVGLDNPEIRSMTVQDSTRLVVGAEHSLFEMTKESGDWSVRKMIETPCRYVTEHLIADDGTLWVGGWDSADGCIASVQDGPWTQYRVPDSELRNRRGSYRIRPRGFVSQPGTDTPLILTRSGVLQPQEDGTLKNEFMGNVLDGAYVTAPHATLVLHERGVIAKYYAE